VLGLALRGRRIFLTSTHQGACGAWIPLVWGPLGVTQRDIVGEQARRPAARPPGHQVPPKIHATAGQGTRTPSFPTQMPNRTRRLALVEMSGMCHLFAPHAKSIHAGSAHARRVVRRNSARAMCRSAQTASWFGERTRRPPGRHSAVLPLLAPGEVRSRCWYGLCLQEEVGRGEIEDVHAARTPSGARSLNDPSHGPARRGFEGCRRPRRGPDVSENATTQDVRRRR